jgi:hypothetical protein
VEFWKHFYEQEKDLSQKEHKRKEDKSEDLKRKLDTNDDDSASTPAPKRVKDGQPQVGSSAAAKHLELPKQTNAMAVMFGSSNIAARAERGDGQEAEPDAKRKDSLFHTLKK